MTNAARNAVTTMFVALALGALMLSGCGQRGPLFLPDEAPAEVTQSPPPATPAPAPETTPAPAPDETPPPEEGKDTERKPDEKPR